ncbi:hypothetical protein LP420_00580 [Massilia sp. B-10]|nr:hypothetical protein LP420_00580 [Massilia sp. B-10]
MPRSRWTRPNSATLSHLRLAALALQAHDVDSAVARTCLSIRAYATHLGAPAKFHWTVTEALVRLLAARPPAGRRARSAGAPLLASAAGQRCGARRVRCAGPCAAARMSRSYTIGQLASACAVSRTALLYYEKSACWCLGLRAALRATGATARPNWHACARLLAYRDAGLPLQTIKALLDGGDQSAAAMPTAGRHLRDMAQLRAQQTVLASLVTGGAAALMAMDKESWSALFRAAGMDEAAMRNWHRLFEQNNPAAHEAFLRSLGLDSAEVARIRAASAP